MTRRVLQRKQKLLSPIQKITEKSDYYGLYTEMANDIVINHSKSNLMDLKRETCVMIPLRQSNNGQRHLIS